MLEKLKTMWDKVKLWLGGAVAALALLFLVFRKKPTSDLGEYLKDESKIKQDSEKKLQEGTVEIQKEVKKQLEEEEQQKNKKLDEAEEKAKDKTEKLVELEIKDVEEFKKQLEKELGVKEKTYKKSKRKKKR